MKKIKTIAVVTGSRAEYGILKPLLVNIKNSKDFELDFYVTGMHLLKKYGNTVDVIKKDGFKINNKILMYKNSDNKDTYIGNGLSRGIKNFAKAFNKNRPNMLLVFGDRFESLAAVLAAAILKIPVGHIHGGDKTDSGHIDESTRNSISRYSHIHFAPTKSASRRLINTGEQAFRVHHVGTLAIDSILEIPKQTKPELCRQLGLDSSKEIIVSLFNPLPVEYEKMGTHARELCSAIKTFKKQTVIIYPNNDAGSKDIIREIEKLRNLEYVSIYKNLPSEQYINLLRNADVLVGNSSSGIIEAPFLKLPVVNVGSRNTGREHAKNIIFVEPKKANIKRGIEKALNDKRFKSIVKNSKNPYGKGGTTNAIIKILNKIEISKKLMLKKVTY